MLLEGPPTPLAGPDRPEILVIMEFPIKGCIIPGCDAAAPPTPLPAALPTPGPPVP